MVFAVHTKLNKQKSKSFKDKTQNPSPFHILKAFYNPADVS
tara:strand:- start:1469 stop:1591 length:123 start_codon:yes stop_codon:yes gene_type:complete